MDSEKAREYLRIADSVEVRYRSVSAGEAADLARDRLERPSIHNLALIRALEEASRGIEEEGGLALLLLHKVLEIDEKLDRISRALSRDGAEPSGLRVSQTMDLSAGGLSFPATEALEAGTFLDLTLHLPTFPALLIRALGAVVRPAGSAEGGAAPLTVGVHFESIHEEDREMLYHYIFQRQREQIRQTTRGGVGILPSDWRASNKS